MILAVDFMNFAHRARAGFALGDMSVTYNIFRNLRALIERMSPTRVFLCLEGRPEKRHDMLVSYKENRRLDAESDDPAIIAKVKDMQSFFHQVDLAVSLLATRFPVSLLRHPKHEADDLIYNIIRRASTAVPWIVLSTDSDFTQLLDEFTHVSVYNPTKREYVSRHECDYVTWKSLRGDACDNVPGIPGIGDVRATKLASDPDALLELFKDKEIAEQFTLNYGLIKFMDWSEEEASEMSSSSPERSWDDVKEMFEGWKFKSITKDGTWQKFCSTFDPLFGTQETGTHRHREAGVWTSSEDVALHSMGAVT